MRMDPFKQGTGSARRDLKLEAQGVSHTEVVKNHALAADRQFSQTGAANVWIGAQTGTKKRLERRIRRQVSYEVCMSIGSVRRGYGTSHPSRPWISECMTSSVESRLESATSSPVNACPKL